MRHRTPPSSIALTSPSARAPLAFLATLALWASSAHAEVRPRRIVDITGDFVIIGNTLAQDCANTAPVVGTVSMCSMFIADASPDVFWRSETSSAAASPSITAERARSTAVLELPAGARVQHAQLYWFGSVFDPPADLEATLERPGGASMTATATTSDTYVQLTPAANRVEYRETLNYLSGADVTAFVAQQGSGPYRVSGVASHPLAEDIVNISQTGWMLVVFYAREGDAPRNLALFDGIDRVVGSTVGVTLDGFRVPQSGFSGKLAILGLDGEVNGAQLRFGTPPLNAADALSDALNPVNRFFNGTRSELGVAVSREGDLPRVTGNANSLSGIDIDVVDITGRLAAGQTTAHMEVAAGPNDGIQTMVWVTSIATLRPDFARATKTASIAGATPPRVGDPIIYTLVIPNQGNDTAVDVVLRDVLPAGLEYAPGTLSVTQGAGAGALTDAAGDDAGEWDAASRTLIVRLGTGATASAGGRLAPGESVTVRFTANVTAAAEAQVDNRGEVEASGLAGAPRARTPTDGDPVAPGAQATSVAIERPALDAGVEDAGLADAGSATGEDAGTAALADAGGVGVDAGPAAEDEDEGCDCAAADRSTQSPPLGELGLIVCALVVAARRRRR